MGCEMGGQEMESRPGSLQPEQEVGQSLAPELLTSRVPKDGQEGEDKLTG